MNAMLPIQILGTGSYLPAEVIRNDHFTSYLDTSDEWIVTRTGIRERRKAPPSECTSTMAVEASKRALADAGLAVEDIDAIICATSTGDYPFPPTAALIQAGLSAPNVPAFDIAAACAGYIYATYVAAGMLTAGIYRRVLVVGSESLSRYGDPEDRRTVVLFGDAAGAAVLARSADPSRGILHYEMGCDGTKADWIWVPAGGAKLYASATTVAERLHYMRMRGREVYKFAVLKMAELIDRALAAAKITAADLKLMVPHQSNLRIIESVRDRLNLPAEKVAVNIDRCGNTSAASVIMALDEHRRKGTLQAGDFILLIGIGAGLTWGTMVLRL